jgi:hypothetical protein
MKPASLLLLLNGLVPVLPAVADDLRPAPSDSFSVMAGMNQVLLGGANLAVQYSTEDIVVEYSHGIHLRLNDLNGIDLNREEKNDHLTVDVPWTTGFGIGYRVTREFHVLVEFKAHRFNVTDPDGGGQVRYTTYSVGPGLFYDWTIWKGLYLEPALRWWPTVASTLPGNDHTFVRSDGTTVTHHAHDWGVFPNVSIGWTF